MKLSFVIPAYNEEKYIASCIAAIQKQIARAGIDSEIIVADNASTDKTAEIAVKAGARVVREERKGTSYARQAGFAASSGELVANIDADTIIGDSWIPKIMHAFERDSKLAAISGPYIFYDMPWYSNVLTYLFYCGGYVLYLFNRFVLRVGSLVQGANAVMRRSALEAIGGYDVSYTFFGDDADLARRLFKVGHVRFSLGLLVYSSGRRVKKEGMLKMAILYALNYLWPIFFKRPFTKPESPKKT